MSQGADSGDTYYRDHWVNIAPEKLERYETMFQWSTAYEALLDRVGIEPGQTVADFGCGPGSMLVEMAKRVGPGGQVHGLDVNAEFVASAREKAAGEGVSGRITLHHLTESFLPLGAGRLDRILAKNVMVYVDDAAETFEEFRRVVRKGGRVLVIDSDFATTIMEPVPLEQWRAFLAGASHAFRNPLIGRQMYGIARKAGFSSVELEVRVTPDTSGRLANMVRNLAGDAREAGILAEAEIQAVVDIVDRAVEAGTFLAINPQFIVTAIV